MYFLSTTTIIEAIKKLNSDGGVDYAAFGLCFVLKNINKSASIKPEIGILFDKNAVSGDLNTNFSFIKIDENIQKLNSRIILSSDYIKKSAQKLFNNNNNKKVDALSFAVICLHNQEFENEIASENLIEKFISIFNIPEDAVNSWFKQNNSSIKIQYVSHKVDLKLRKKDIWAEFNYDENHSSIGFPKSIKSTAGGWGSSAYIQKFAPSSLTKDFIFIPDGKITSYLVDQVSTVKLSTKNITASQEQLNKIYFGPAGTGKSYKAREDLKNLGIKDTNIIEVTFHPEYTYYDFFGSLKPSSLYKKSPNTVDLQILNTPNDQLVLYEGLDPMISYGFEAGPFLQAVKQALKNPSDKIALLIDEMNRGNIPEIMGDLFHLLDRNSSYISKTNIEAIKFLKETNDKIDSLSLPNNLFIYATVNPSDQNVFPLDTAFKRRWDWEYVGINYQDPICANWQLEYGDKKIGWLYFIKVTNQYILNSLQLSEDKQLGQFFIYQHNDNNYHNDSLKVIKYLWEDIPKHKRNMFFSDSIQDFGSLLHTLENEGVEAVFTPEFSLLLSEIMNE